MRLNPLIATVIISLLLPSCGPGSADAPVATLSVPLGFSDHGQGTQYFGSGWSAPESWGTWSVGPNAYLLFRLPRPGGNVKLHVKARGFEPEAGKKQQVAVLFQNGVIGNLKLGSEDEWFEFVIPASSFGEVEGPYKIEFHIAEPKSPFERNINNDKRLLGIGLAELVLELQ